MIKSVVIITSFFPFYPGEQFLETEVLYWSTRHALQVTIMPLSTGTKVRREMPGNILLDLSLCEQKSIVEKIKVIIKSFVSLELYEIICHEKPRNTRLICLIESYANYLLSLHKINASMVGRLSEPDICIYTYWNVNFTHALQSLKSFYDFKLISRIHRSDLYEESRKSNYIPLKRYFSSNIDEVHVLTESAKKYMINRYNYKDKEIKISRLGVENRNIRTYSSNDKNYIHLLSCSYVVQVKRLDKIVNAIYEINLKNPNKKIKWTHIGSGCLQSEIQKLAEKKLMNVDFNFLGDMKNENVFSFYKSTEIDVFINASESEGVPVSIMEAMSCHIPVIAPDVGGVSDIINHGENGKLLSPDCEVSEIVSALKDFQFFKSKLVRENARNTYLIKFNAELNYNKFIDKVVEN